MYEKGEHTYFVIFFSILFYLFNIHISQTLLTITFSYFISNFKSSRTLWLINFLLSKLFLNILN